MPLKGYHAKQFLLGYIDGTQGILNNKAEVVGYMHMEAFVNSESMTYYNQGKQTRCLVKDGAQYPLGDFPTHITDNYLNLYIGNHDGDTQRDASDYMTYECPSGHSTEYCMGFKIGWFNEDDLINPLDDNGNAIDWR
jgi:hypothetical protein